MHLRHIFTSARPPGLPILHPQTHVTIVRRRIDAPYDWATDVQYGPDLTPPHGVDRPDVDGWLRTELG